MGSTKRGRDGPDNSERGSPSRSGVGPCNLMARVRPRDEGQCVGRPCCCSFALAKADRTLCGGCGTSPLTPFSLTELPGSRATRESLRGPGDGAKAAFRVSAKTIATVGARVTSRSVFRIAVTVLGQSFCESSPDVDVYSRDSLSARPQA
jgi:hypothetical protein